ncbi:MAG: YraN family protein [Motiliproteus sp.]
MSRRKGDQIEQQAERYLQQQGLKPLQRNFKARGGEIDLIMHDKTALVFIEVRFRRSNLYGSAAETVDYRKQQRIINSAMQFLQQHPKYCNLACRFDVVACQPDNSTHGLGIEWFKNAFETS